MTQLELKHLSPYLPYSLKIQDASDCIWTLHYYRDALDNFGDNEHISLYQVLDENEISGGSIHKPILRPLSALIKEIEHDGEKFVPVIRLSEIFDKTYNTDSWNADKVVQMHIVNIRIHGVDYVAKWFAEQLTEWHFDVFGLIEKDLAVPYNQNPTHP